LNTVESAYLVMGCYGRSENGFALCTSVHNRILKLDDSLVNIDGVMDYLDAVKLFDRPMLDQNAIRHLVHNLQDRFDQKFKRLWTDHEYNLLERFIQMHKPCGIFAQVVLTQDSNEEVDTEKDQISFVRGIPETRKVQNVKTNLSLVRGARVK